MIEIRGSLIYNGAKDKKIPNSILVYQHEIHDTDITKMNSKITSIKDFGKILVCGSDHENFVLMKINSSICQRTVNFTPYKKIFFMYSDDFIQCSQRCYGYMINRYSIINDRLSYTDYKCSHLFDANIGELIQEYFGKIYVTLDQDLLNLGIDLNVTGLPGRFIGFEDLLVINDFFADDP